MNLPMQGTGVLRHAVKYFQERLIFELTTETSCLVMEAPFLEQHFRVRIVLRRNAGRAETLYSGFEFSAV